MITIGNFTHRLGNQLFQIAAGYALALDRSTDFIISDWSYKKHFPNVKNYGAFLSENKWHEPDFSYHHISKEVGSGLELHGYFQSEKYFIHRRREILELFALRDGLYSETIKKNPDFSAARAQGKARVSVHFRLTDYRGLPEHHPVLPEDYYIHAMQTLQDKHDGNVQFFLFSDEIDSPEVNRIADHFTNCTKVKGQTDIEDFCLQSLCDDNIIANSSFSWWSAWLNINNNKTIITPHKSKWHGKAYAHWNHDDVIPEDWTQLIW